MLSKLQNDVRELFFPRICPVCEGRLLPDESFICSECLIEFPLLKFEKTDDNQMIRTLWGNIPVAHAVSIFAYRHHSIYHNLLLQIKYRGNARLAQQLGTWAATQIRDLELEEKADVIVPVPLSRRKQWERGYNQAYHLALGLSKIYQLPVQQWLTSKVDRQTQTHMNAQQRIENTQGSYAAKIPESERGKRILLVDDVMTTGATIIACTNAILEVDKTAEISVFTLALSK